MEPDTTLRAYEIVVDSIEAVVVAAGAVVAILAMIRVGRSFGRMEHTVESLGSDIREGFDRNGKQHSEIFDSIKGLRKSDSDITERVARVEEHTRE